MTDAIHFSARTFQPEKLRAVESADVVILSHACCPILADALEIADESAVCLIESSSSHAEIDGERWWGTDNDPSVAMEQALRYLNSRGLLERHGEWPHLVRFREAA